MSAKRFEITLTLVSALLASASAYEIGAPLGELAVPTVNAPALPTPAPITPFNPPPSSSFATIDARPIFSPQRKPIESTAVPGNAAAVAPPGVALIGVILDGKTQMALVKRDGAPFAQSIALGGTLDGWEVTEIGADHIALRSGAQELVLSMDGKRKTQPSAPQASPTNPASPANPTSALPLARGPVKPNSSSAQTRPPQDAGADDQSHSDATGAP